MEGWAACGRSGIILRRGCRWCWCWCAAEVVLVLVVVVVLVAGCWLLVLLVACAGVGAFWVGGPLRLLRQPPHQRIRTRL